MDDEIFEIFTQNVTAEQLREAAGRLVFRTGHALDVYRAGGGPVAHEIKERLLKGTRKVTHLSVLTQRLLSHYGLVDYYPPVPLVRDALALVVQLKQVIGKVHPDFYGVLSELVDRSDGWESASDVFAASYEDVEKVVQLLPIEGR